MHQATYRSPRNEPVHLSRVMPSLGLLALLAGELAALLSLAAALAGGLLLAALYLM